MNETDDLQHFVRQFHLAQTEQQLLTIVDEATRQLGFDQFSIRHHVDLSVPPDDAIAFGTFDPDWVDLVLRERYFIDDPILAASRKTAVGFLWSDVGKLIDLTERQKHILEQARAFGLSDGFTVPVQVPGEYHGSCSFGAASLNGLGRDSLAKAQLIGVFAFEAARRLVRMRKIDQSSACRPQLTSRQIDCITLVAMGKSDWEIGRILGISEATAHEHVESARKRYKVSKRTQLVIRALFDGQITFADILH